MTGFGYTSGSGTGFTPIPGPLMGSRFTNNSGVVQYIISVDLLLVWSTGAPGAAFLGVFEDDNGLPGELMAQVSAPSGLGPGTNTFTLPQTLVVEDGQSVWGFVQGGTSSLIGTIAFDGGVIATKRARQSGETLGSGGFYQTVNIGQVTNFIVPLFFNGGGSAPPTTSEVRVDLAVLEPLAEGDPHAAINLALLEPLAEGNPRVSIGLLLIEALIPVPVEETMVSTTLPGFGNSLIDPTLPAALDRPPLMRGLTFPIHKKPEFNTRVSNSASLNSTRIALADYPRWNFELTFSFLEDYTGPNSTLRLMEGAFCNAKGKALPFLYKDPDDYIETAASLGTADGVTLQFDFMRWIGTYSEPVGQVDTANIISIYGGLDEADSVPGSGPYTVTVAHAADFAADGGVKIAGTPLTKVASSPGAMQYSVAAGVYTFNSAQHGASAVISYTYLIDPSDYSIVMPNKVLFGSAPADGLRLSAGFQYFFTCYFDIDIADFSKFASQLWELKSLTFHSELLA